MLLVRGRNENSKEKKLTEVSFHKENVTNHKMGINKCDFLFVAVDRELDHFDFFTLDLIVVKFFFMLENGT